MNRWTNKTHNVCDLLHRCMTTNQSDTLLRERL